jgi:multiple sugar transport system substrate-binding protein
MLRKSLLSSLASVLTISLGLVGCSSGEVKSTNTAATAPPTAKGAGGKITVWVHPFLGDGEKDKEKKMWEQIKGGFEKENPEAKLDIVELPWDNREAKILSAIAVGEGPDVFYTNPDYVVKFANKGILAPLSANLKGMDMSDFTNSSLETVKFKGDIYGLPILQSIVTIFYNLDIVKEIGEDPNKLPTTWDEFKGWAAKAKDKGKIAINFHGTGAPNIYLYPYIWQTGGTIISKDNKVVVNQGQNVEAFKFINEMYKNGWIPSDSISAKTQVPEFMAGRMMAVIGDNVLNTQIKAQNVPFKWGVGTPLKLKETKSYSTTGAFVIPNNTKNKDGAVAFMKYVTDSETSQLFNKTTNYLPARKSAYTIFKGDAVLEKIATQVEASEPGILSPIGPNIGPFAQAEVQAMLSGKKTPEQAINDLAKAIETEMKKEGN